MTAAILVALLIPTAIMIGVWAYHERTHKSGWIDVAWTAAVGLGAVGGSLWPFDGVAARPGLYAAMAALWSLRLSWHLAQRTLGHPDDVRYAKMRKEWGASSPLKMFGLLLFQAVVAAVLAICVVLVARAPASGLTGADIAAAALFLVALIGETTADAQMRSFRAAPANHGKICDVGLWRWSRHPNYFFEWLSWVAIAIGVLAAPAWLPGWIALAAPLMMLHLLLNMSGVPPLEAHMRRTRGSAWAAYVARTSRFVPLPPKTGAKPAGKPAAKPSGARKAAAAPPPKPKRKPRLPRSQRS
jgi:steroid 5-alpha reductase family enzyme